jgi:SAM-dependent methyltransferase
MDDNTLEIREDESNIEEFMGKIRDTIRRRQTPGEQPPDLDSIFGSLLQNCYAGELNNPITRDLPFINSNWDIRNKSYVISSHRPFIGKFLVKGRQIVHSEVGCYVDPILTRQAEFNRSTSRILARVAQQYTELDRKISRNDEGLTFFIQNNVDASLKEFFSKMDKSLQLQMGLVHILEERMQKRLAQISITALPKSPADLNYLLFEERFRGSREDMRRRQMAFLPYFEKCSRVLDVGCGRGEFLEILLEQNIGGIGVDLDTDMVAYCKSRQLQVDQGDAITYLENLEDNSLDGIFIDQVVEHLEPDYLIRLLALCYQKMKFGYYIVVETVNPLSFVSFANFFIDMTHKRPVHPDTLNYLMNAAGFRDCQKKFFSPVSDEGRLKKIKQSDDMDLTQSENVAIYNQNIEMLNAVLFGAQDYAIVGKK